MHLNGTPNNITKVDFGSVQLKLNFRKKFWIFSHFFFYQFQILCFYKVYSYPKKRKDENVMLVLPLKVDLTLSYSILFFPHRWGSHGYISCIVPSRAINNRERGRSKQLRSRSLHSWQRIYWPMSRSNSEINRGMYWSPRFSDFPFIWWRNWVWFFFTFNGTSLSWLWKEI